MPIYLYSCKQGHEYEIEQSINDKPLEKCVLEGCFAKVERLIFKTSFILKGKGWGKDGYSK